MYGLVLEQEVNQVLGAPATLGYITCVQCTEICNAAVILQLGQATACDKFSYYTTCMKTTCEG